MSNTDLKRRDSSSSDKENDPKWNPQINLKRVKTEPPHEENVSDSPSQKTTTSETTGQNDDSSSTHSTNSTLGSSTDEFLSSSSEELSNPSDQTWTLSPYINNSSDSLDETSSDNSVKSPIENVDDFVTLTNNNDDNLTQDVTSVVIDLVFAMHQVQDDITMHQMQEMASSAGYLEQKDT